jgi:hypothetical protein
MSTAAKHEFHPDAELLNAFAERALDDRERSQVLAHLAVCGRCRQVLTMAQQAAAVDVEELVATAAPARPAAAIRPVRPRAWWRNWYFAWIPAAAIAATVSFAAYLHVVHVERTAEMAQNSQPAAQPEALATQPALQSKPKPRPQAETQPPALPQSAPARTAGPAASHPNGHEAPRTVPAPEVAAAPPPPMAAPARPPAATETVTVSQDASAPQTISSQELSRIDTRQLAPAKALQGATSASNSPMEKKGTQSELKQFAARKRQDTPAVERDQLSSASANPGQAAASAPAIVGGSSAENQQKPTSRAEAAGSLRSFHGVASPGAIAAKQIHLPSGLDAISVTSANQLQLALDREGTLFLSKDEGAAWQQIPSQWKGRAILIRRKSSASPPSAAPPADGLSVGAIGGAQTSPPPAPIFEIVNDQHQVWQSTDGINWTAK